MSRKDRPGGRRDRGRGLFRPRTQTEVEWVRPCRSRGPLVGKERQASAGIEIRIYPETPGTARTLPSLAAGSVTRATATAVRLMRTTIARAPRTELWVAIPRWCRSWAERESASCEWFYMRQCWPGGNQRATTAWKVDLVGLIDSNSRSIIKIRFCEPRCAMRCDGWLG